MSKTFDTVVGAIVVLFVIGLFMDDDAETTSANATKRASQSLNDRYAACRKGRGIASGDWRVSCSKRDVFVSANATSESGDDFGNFRVELCTSRMLLHLKGDSFLPRKSLYAFDGKDASSRAVYDYSMKANTLRLTGFDSLRDKIMAGNRMTMTLTEDSKQPDRKEVVEVSLRGSANAIRVGESICDAPQRTKKKTAVANTRKTPSPAQLRKFWCVDELYSMKRDGVDIVMRSGSIDSRTAKRIARWEEKCNHISF